MKLSFRSSGLLLMLFSICQLTVAMEKSKISDLNRDLTVAELAINKKLPTIIDSELRIDEVKAGDRELSYFITFFKHSKKEIKLDDLKTEMSKKLLGQACSNRDYLTFLKNGVQLRMVYRSKELEELVVIIIQPSHYGYKNSK